MAHTKKYTYQIRISNADTDALIEKVDIDWDVTIHKLPITNQMVVGFTDTDGNPGNYIISPEYTIDIGFFEQ